MKVSDDLKAVLNKLLTEDFRSMEAYDAALEKVRYLAMAEHRRISTDEDGTQLVSVARKLGADFVVDTYFAGIKPEKSEREYRKLVDKLRAAMMGYLKVTYGIGTQAPVYTDDISEIRVRLLNVAEMKQAIESRVGRQTLDLLEKYQQLKVGTLIKESAGDDVNCNTSVL